MSPENSPESKQSVKERQDGIVQILDTCSSSVQEAIFGYLRQHGLPASVGDLPENISEKYTIFLSEVSGLVSRMTDNIGFIPENEQVDDVLEDYQELLNLLEINPDVPKPLS